MIVTSVLGGKMFEVVLLNREKIHRALEVASRAGALLIANDAKRFAPVRTGNLRRSIHSEVVSSTPNTVEVAVGTNVEYARRLEFGFAGFEYVREHRRRGRTVRPFTRYAYTRPRPFMRPAFEQNRSRVVQEIRLAFQRALK